MSLTDIRSGLRGAVATVLTVGVCACGGGGGGGGSPPSNPVVGTTTFSTIENLALNGTITATDPGGGAVTFTQGSSPKSGTLSGFTSAGAFVYTPNASFTGSDSFTVTATDAASHASTATVTITVAADQAPVVNNTVVRSDAPTKIDVLANASSPTKESLTVTVTPNTTFPAPAAATVNSDQSVSISGLPASFKGLASFHYTVTDQSGMVTKGAAAIFVGTDPFRAVFAADAAGNGANEVYLTDFAQDPAVMTAATQGNLRLEGFAVSDNGATVAYRTEDTTSSAKTSLAFVKTAAPTQSTSIPLPSGTVPVPDGNGKDQFVVSPDGQWIAAVAGQGSLNSLYVLNTTQPAAVSQIQPAGVTSVGSLTFSLDSKSIYFLASSSPQGAHRSLYFASLSSPGQTTLISALSDPATTSDDVSAYSVSPDQARVLLQAVRNGKEGVFFVATPSPGVENQLNEPVVGQSVGATTVGLPAGRGGSTTVSRVAYVVQGASTTHPPGIYVAEVSTTPHPRLEVQNANVEVVGLRPDDAAFLYTDQAQVSEVVIDTPGAQSVGGGYGGWYDSTGNIVLLQQHLPYSALASTSRGNFGTTNSVGTTSLAVAYADASGFDRGIAIIGQGPTSGSAPASAILELVNAQAPQGLLPLASFQSPLQLTSDSSKIVSQ